MLCLDLDGDDDDDDCIRTISASQPAALHRSGMPLTIRRRSFFSSTPARRHEIMLPPLSRSPGTSISFCHFEMRDDSFCSDRQGVVMFDKADSEGWKPRMPLLSLREMLEIDVREDPFAVGAAGPWAGDLQDIVEEASELEPFVVHPLVLLPLPLLLSDTIRPGTVR